MAPHDSAARVREAGDLVIRNRRHLAQAARRRTLDAPGGLDPFAEVGTSGLRQFGGFVLEEWLLSLGGRKAAWVWREMLDNDPTVGAILFAIRWLASGVEWRVEEGNDPEAAQLVEECVDDMSHTWGDFVSEALSFLPYGWAYHEIVYKRRDGPQAHAPSDPRDEISATSENDSSPASSKYRDGKIGWRKLPIRAQETLLRWEFDGYSGIRAMNQVDWHGGNHVIPIEKALLFRTQTTRNNPEGRSILRNAYTSYWAVKNVKQIEAIGIERDLAGIPMATPPEGVDLYSAANAGLLHKVQQLVTSVRRDEYDGIVLPSAGWQFELLKAAGARQVDTDAVVRRYRQDIAGSVLGEWVLIGMDSVGSYAMVDVKSDVFGMALDGILDLQCEVLNRYAIPRLLRINGMDDSDPPRISHGSAGRINLEKVGSFLNALYLAGAPIPWSLQMLRALFAEAGLPANFEEQDSPADLPGVQDANREDAEAQEQADERRQQGEDQADQEQAADAQRQGLTKAQVSTGAMVALYPHPDVAQKLAQDGGEPAHELHLTLAFLGRASAIENPDEVRQAVALWAARTPPLSGAVSGTGTFTAGPQPVSYASADLPELPEHRQRLIGALERIGAPASREHGFTPHITLAYESRSPEIESHPLRFTHATLKLGDQRHDFPLSGLPHARVAKAEHTAVRGGTLVHVGPALEQRASQLSGQLQREIDSALAELGERAAVAYMGAAQKAAMPNLHRVVSRVVQSLGLREWFAQRLQPLLHNHAARVSADTQRTLRAEIGIELGLGEQAAQRVAARAGDGLGLRDVQSQVRQAILTAVREGFQSGEHPSKIAVRIRDSVPAGRFAHAGARYRSQLIARDQTARLQRAASLELYRSNPRIARLRIRDGVYGPPRSDAACMSRDGNEVSLDAAEDVAPYHPLCTLGFEPVVTGALRPATVPAPVVLA